LPRADRGSRSRLGEPRHDLAGLAVAGLEREDAAVLAERPGPGAGLEISAGPGHPPLDVARLPLHEPLPLRQALHVLLGLPETLGELDAIRDRPRVEGDRPAIGFEGPRPIPRRIERLPVREVARGVERPFGERTVPLRARGRPLSLVAQLLGE